MLHSASDTKSSSLPHINGISFATKDISNIAPNMQGSRVRRSRGSRQDVLQHVVKAVQSAEFEIMLLLSIGIATFVVRGLLVSKTS